jgi:vacuolar-type H+-ATPase subunit E/Vma4
MTAKSQKAVLIDSIKKAADDEAQRILNDAHQVVKDRKKSTNEQILLIKKNFKKKEEQQLAKIAQEGKLRIETLERKKRLELKQNIVNHVMEQVREEFSTFELEHESREMLIEWGVEAALGLEESDPILKVTESCASFIDDEYCYKVAHRYKEFTGKDIEITVSSDVIKKGYGLIIEAKNGKTAYNNLLKDRIYRNQETIEALVLEEIFDE